MYSPFLGRGVLLRGNGADQLTYESVFDDLYHVPPARMATPASVLDLGANIGLTCAYYRKLWPDAKVIGVEMDADNLAVARKNTDVEILHYAVTDNEDGPVGYFSEEFATSFSIVRDYYSRDRVVTPKRVGSLIREHFAGAVDFVKMDIEGAEWDVLLDAEWPPMVKNLLLEVHGDSPLFADRFGENVPDNLVAQATPILEGLGFKVERHLPHLQSVFAWR